MTLDDAMGSSLGGRRGPGRRSFSGSGDSPQIRLRVPAELRGRIEATAARSGRTLSEFARDALEQALIPERREVMVGLELHRAVLMKFLDEGMGPHLSIIERNFSRISEAVSGPIAFDWLEEWRDLLDGPLSRLVGVMLSLDEHSIDLRQMSPFAGVLTTEERLDALRRARPGVAA